MSEWHDIAMSKTTIFIKPKEGLLLSVVRDLFTLATVALLVYVSQGSVWWTLITGIMFLIFVYAKVTSLVRKNGTTFATKEEAIAYLQRLDS
jgi:hypothetical protein